MSSIISYPTASGHVFRCDATCINAQGQRCRCICGGVYHGAGNTPGELQRRIKAHGRQVLEDAAGIAAQLEEDLWKNIPNDPLPLFPSLEANTCKPGKPEETPDKCSPPKPSPDTSADS